MTNVRQSLDGQSFDVVIVGAGAVGCTTARELAARGYRTLLLDRADIGSGTSSRSSRMLYSGLGYLAVRYPLWQMALHPVDMMRRLIYARDVMRCRAELVETMPQHLTRHRFFYPFRRGDRYPPWLVDIGFRMMEMLGGWRVPLHYRRSSRAEASSGLVDRLGPVTGIGSFDEYMYAWPERTCVDTALDAERRGATIRTYTAVVGVEREASGCTLRLEDRSPDRAGPATVSAKMIVNAAGPWIDRIAGDAGAPRVRGIKGVNVMVRLPESFHGQGLEAFSSKGEPFYVFPWRDLHFVGPTETVVTDDPDDVSVLPEEVDYVLSEANRLFPDLHLSRNDVAHCWCGVRPTSTIDGKTTALPVRVVERDGSPGLIAVTGSTIMLHRHAGRLAARAVEKRLGKRGAGPSGSIPLGPPDVTDILRDEHVVRLGDLVRRRLPNGLDPDLGRDGIEDLSHTAAAALGWSETRRAAEVAEFLADTAKIYPGAKTLP